jgi:hypothetical protein
MTTVAERAERLRLSLLMFGLVREEPNAALEGVRDTGLLTPAEWDVWRQSDDADLELANACLAAAQEVRRREWEAFERLLARITPSEGDLTNRMLRLSFADFLAAVRDLDRLGWIDDEGWRIPGT